jgi:imidazolonepropionase-like amidohydrolase
MRRSGFALVLFLGTANSGTGGEGLVLSDVTVIDGTGGAPLHHQDVHVRGGRIIAVNPHTTSPGEDAVLPLPGRFVLPGYVDMHVHLLAHPWNEKGELARRFDRPSVERFLRLLLAHGVTTVRDPGSETEAALTLRRMQREGRLVGPAILTAGRILNASGFDPEPFQPVANADDVRREVRFQADAGVDFIKLYASITPELARVAIEEAHGRGLPVIGHLQRTTWTEAARLGIDALTHAAPWSAEYLPEALRRDYRGDIEARATWLEEIDLDSPVVREMIAALVEHHVTLDPTLIAMHTKFFGDDPRWLQNPDNALMPALHRRGWPAGSFTAGWTSGQYARTRRSWPRLQALVRRYHAQAVRLTVGTDAPTPWIVPGASLHDEMRLLAEAGIPPADVLRMATHDAAVGLGREQEIGAVRAGLRADLVVLTKDPLADIGNTRSIELVVQGGVVLRPQELLSPSP